MFFRIPPNTLVVRFTFAGLFYILTVLIFLLIRLYVKKKDFASYEIAKKISRQELKKGFYYMIWIFLFLILKMLEIATPVNVGLLVLLGITINAPKFRK